MSAGFRQTKTDGIPFFRQNHNNCYRKVGQSDRKLQANGGGRVLNLKKALSAKELRTMKDFVALGDRALPAFESAAAWGETLVYWFRVGNNDGLSHPISVRPASAPQSGHYNV